MGIVLRIFNSPTKIKKKPSFALLLEEQRKKMRK